jgi:small subunit ribosomal protein S4e
MGKKGPTRHMKRHISPNFWPIHRKAAAWAVKPKPGAHRAKVSIPLIIVLRDFLKYAKTSKEARMLVHQGKVTVDGKIRRDPRYSIGLMDVLELQDTGESFRVLPDHGGRFILHSIPKEEASFKLCRITGKTTLNGGLTQLNLHDGRNLRLENGNETYSINDIIKINLQDQGIIEKLEFKAGVRTIITGGRRQGQYGILMGLGTEPGKKKTATIRTPENEDVRTLSEYVFAVGTEAPIISLPGGM